MNEGPEIYGVITTRPTKVIPIKTDSTSVELPTNLRAQSFDFHTKYCGGVVRLNLSPGHYFACERIDEEGRWRLCVWKAVK